MGIKLFGLVLTISMWSTILFTNINLTKTDTHSIEAIQYPVLGSIFKLFNEKLFFYY